MTLIVGHEFDHLSATRAERVLLVTGSREWRNQDQLEGVLCSLVLIEDFTVLVHGDCKTGADAMAKAWGIEHGLIERSYPANWDKFGNAAGPIRNEQMVLQSKPSFAVAFNIRTGNGRLTKGTGNCVVNLMMSRIPTLIVPERP